METLETLKTIQWVVQWSPSSAEIINKFGISRATLSRRIKRMRDLGVDVVPKKHAGKVSGWYWKVENEEKCRKQIEIWMRLELNQDLQREVR